MGSMECRMATDGTVNTAIGRGRRRVRISHHPQPFFTSSATVVFIGAKSTTRTSESRPIRPAFLLPEVLPNRFKWVRTDRFLKSSTGVALTLGSAVLAPAGLRASDEAAPIAPRSPSGRSKVIDCHAHLTHRSSASWESDDRKLIEAADQLGIDQLCCSILTPRRPATAEGFRECNQWVADGMRRFPGRVLGYCYVNPGYGQEASEEIRRCVEERGFIGVKLYNEYT
jgi:hypothetical protein